jgi:hypothetical protein
MTKQAQNDDPKVRCPHCQAAVSMRESFVDLGAMVALVCPECHEVSLA